MYLWPTLFSQTGIQLKVVFSFILKTPMHCGHFSAPAPVLDTVNLSGYDDVSSENYSLQSCIIIKVSMGKSIMTYKAIRLLNHLRWKIYGVQGWGKKRGKSIKITYICNFSYLKQTRYRHHPSPVHQNIASLSPEGGLLVASVGYIHGGYQSRCWYTNDQYLRYRSNDKTWTLFFERNHLIAITSKRTFTQDLSASPYSCLLTTKLNINASIFHDFF